MGTSNVEDAKHCLEVAKTKLAGAKESMKRDLEREKDPQRKKSIRATRMATIERYKAEVERSKEALARAKANAKKR
ncbi:MAG: hypothetical protein K2K08_09130, partial [Paramuribaculum sp.]|nr:hypothetical protein [Paramuribaculum sp.]